MFPLC